MSRRRIYGDELHARFVAFSCYRRRRLLDHARARQVVISLLATELAGYFKTIDRKDPFWQPRYYPFNLYSEKKAIEKLDTMHLNPVRFGREGRGLDVEFGPVFRQRQAGRRAAGVDILLTILLLPCNTDTFAEQASEMAMRFAAKCPCHPRCSKSYAP